MKYKYLIYLPIMFYLFRYFAYKINLKLVFRSDKIKLNMTKIIMKILLESFIKCPLKLIN